jgi:hypothetical protein
MHQLRILLVRRFLLSPTTMWISFFVVLALNSALCRAAIHENVADLEKLNLLFDFIVVGGTCFCISCLCKS